MKFTQEEIAPSGKTRYLFALGKSEAMVLFALIEKAKRYMPSMIQTHPVEARLRNMAKVIGKAIPNMKDDEGQLL